MTEFDYELVKNVFYPPYFVIGGEYYKLDDMLNGKKKLFKPNCLIQNLFLIKKLNVLKNQAANCRNESLTPEDCPDPLGADVSLVITIFYALFMPILLVNLLIAIFK